MTKGSPDASRPGPWRLREHPHRQPQQSSSRGRSDRRSSRVPWRPTPRRGPQRPAHALRWCLRAQVLVTSNRTALIELVPDALSIHTVKARCPPAASLSDHFFARFGRRGAACEAAQRAFAESMAAYSLVCYLLQMKVRPELAPALEPPACCAPQRLLPGRPCNFASSP